MDTELIPGEIIKRQGGANSLRGLANVSGRLYLTNKRLIFESHILNLQAAGTTIIDLEDIKDVGGCWTKFMNFLPLFPNSIRIVTRDDWQYKFVCYNRGKWISMIYERIPR